MAQHRHRVTAEGFKPYENPAAFQAEIARAASNAAVPQADKRHKRARTRKASESRDIRDQLK